MNYLDAFASPQASRDPLNLKFRTKVYFTKTAPGMGRCKHCGKEVPWDRSRMLAHKDSVKSSTCVSSDGSPPGKKEAAFFELQRKLRKDLKRPPPVPAQRFSNESPKRLCASGAQGPDLDAVKEPQLEQVPVASWSDSISVGACERISKKVAALAYRTGIPMAIIDSDAWRDLMEEIRPAYAPYRPPAKQIRGSILNNAYDELFKKLEAYLKLASSYVLISDGWSNHQGQHFDTTAEEEADSDE